MFLHGEVTLPKNFIAVAILRISSRREIEEGEGLPLAASRFSGASLASTLAARDKRAFVTLEEMFLGLMIGELPKSRLTRRMERSAFLTTSEKRARWGITVGAGVAGGSVLFTFEMEASVREGGLFLAVTVDQRLLLPKGACLSGALAAGTDCGMSRKLLPEEGWVMGGM
jgi:hypothetical protein